jgi:hypothetical protein
MISYVSPNINPAYFETPTISYPNELLIAAAKEKQNQFQRGLDTISSQYAFYKNLETFSDKGTELKNSYLNKAKDDLITLVGFDLSLAANVGQSSKIYTPLLQDTFIQTDILNSNRRKKGFENANFFKTSKDEKERKQYNISSERNMLREDAKFKKAQTLDDLKNLDYTYVPAPAEGLSEKIFKIFKDNNLSKEGGMSIMDAQNPYWLITQINGPQAIPALTMLGNSLITPEYRAYYASVAKDTYNSEKEKVVASKFMTGDEYDNTVVNGILATREKQITHSIAGLEANIKLVDDALKRDDVKTYAEDTPEVLAQKIAKQDALEKQKIAYSLQLETSKGKLKDFNDNKQNLFGIIKSNIPEYLGQQKTYEVAKDAATGFAHSTYKVSYAENWIGKENLQHLHKLTEENNKTNNTLKEITLRNSLGQNNDGNDGGNDRGTNTDNNHNKKTKLIPSLLIGVSPNTQDFTVSTVVEFVNGQKNEIVAASNKNLEQIIDGSYSLFNSNKPTLAKSQLVVNKLFNKVKSGEGSTGVMQLPTEDLNGIISIIGKDTFDNLLKEGGNANVNNLFNKVLDVISSSVDNIKIENLSPGDLVKYLKVKTNLSQYKTNANRARIIGEAEEKAFKPAFVSVLSDIKNSTDSYEAFLANKLFSSSPSGNIYAHIPVKNNKNENVVVQFPVSSKHALDVLFTKYKDEIGLFYNEYNLNIINDASGTKIVNPEGVSIASEDVIKELLKLIDQSITPAIGRNLSVAKDSEGNPLFKFGPLKNNQVAHQLYVASIKSGSVVNASENLIDPIDEFAYKMTAEGAANDDILKLNGLEGRSEKGDTFKKALSVLNTGIASFGQGMDGAFILDTGSVDPTSGKAIYTLKFSSDFLKKLMDGLPDDTLKDAVYQYINTTIRANGIKTTSDHSQFIREKLENSYSPYAYQVLKSEDKTDVPFKLDDTHYLRVVQINDSPQEFKIEVVAGKDVSDNEKIYPSENISPYDLTDKVNTALVNLSKYWLDAKKAATTTTKTPISSEEARKKIAQNNNNNNNN